MILYNVENRENSILLKFLENANKKKTKNTTEGIEYDLEKNYIFNIRRVCIQYQERQNNIIFIM